MPPHNQRGCYKWAPTGGQVRDSRAVFVHSSAWQIWDLFNERESDFSLFFLLSLSFLSTDLIIIMRKITGKHLLCLFLLSIPLSWAEDTKKDVRKTENDTGEGSARSDDNLCARSCSFIFGFELSAVRCGVQRQQRTSQKKKQQQHPSSICHNETGWFCKVSLVCEIKCCENKYLKWGETEVVHTCVSPSHLNVYLKRNNGVLEKEIRLRIFIFTILKK